MKNLEEENFISIVVACPILKAVLSAKTDILLACDMDFEELGITSS